jgi:hypothetical protein
MWLMLIYIVLFGHLNIIASSMNSITVIHNVSLRMLNYNSTIMNGPCQECLCAMFLNATPISAFNCFKNNKTCELFSNSLQSSFFTLTKNEASSVYFSSLPIDSPTSETTFIPQSTTSSISKSVRLWNIQKIRMKLESNDFCTRFT